MPSYCTLIWFWMSSLAFCSPKGDCKRVGAHTRARLATPI